MDHINIKVSLGGETGVGKTSFSNKFLYKKFDYTETTIGASFLTKETTFNNKLYKFQIWDTAGQERYYSLAPLYYRGAEAVILIYDITKNDTFELIKNKWLPDIKKLINHNNITIIGNKLDLEEKRQVPKEEVLKFVEENDLLFYELSSKIQDDSIDKCFDEILKKLNKNEPDKKDNDLSIPKPRTFSYFNYCKIN